MNDKPVNELDNTLQQRLELLRQVPERDPAQAARSRAAYLSQAHSLAASKRPTRTSGFWQRLRNSLGSFAAGRGRRLAPVPVLVSLLLALALLFGAGASSVYAAQASTPASWLYPVKLWSEDLRLNAASGPEQKIQLALAFANRRIEEIAALQGVQRPTPDSVYTRLEAQNRLALQQASQMEDAALQAPLTQISMNLQRQEQTLQMLQNVASAPNKAMLANTRLQLEHQAQLANLGLEDPYAFRLALRQEQPQAPLGTEVHATSESPAFGADPTTTHPDVGGPTTPDAPAGEPQHTPDAPGNHGTQPGGTQKPGRPMNTQAPGPSGPGPNGDTGGNNGGYMNPNPSDDSSGGTGNMDGSGSGPRRNTDESESGGGSDGQTSTATEETSQSGPQGTQLDDPQPTAPMHP